ncbi:protein phosphatase CheZ [Ponticaulis sp.]|uniref:protein phosphatase CheZ n=1 Tax=Ponticaulis sp. TaxID=2020902 RepID=UPI000B68B9BC|nr:protein phosphatase CheZ [Ponticaulis sp.]MAJ08675.1 chemotaxis protein CheZ [Ponticaulis sp.]RPG17381.1 MAG: chemotaxis protein CheZ [Hyphomonadaceae bacterium TMED125]HBH88787.1 chemotaxis protein CheZ [Hyphomonadaceae bacterium]HBJ93442.1 chemotaxis protein CheZ [Hyphomonadaceae bacterium]|tara:strand:- start:8235 stop:8963 length:729 start_codon:yes stop_codon:yes gene_type:complete
MGANDAALRVKEAISHLKSQNVKDRQLVDVLELSGVLTDAMGHFFSALDETIKDEFVDIAGFIKKARNEIGDLRPKDIKTNRIPSAGEELEAIVADTEIATDKIMQTAEDVLAMDPDSTEDFGMQIQDKMLVIIEACSFQDLTGQRVSKVVNTLKQIEDRISRFAEVMGVDEDEVEVTPEEQRRRDLLLNGPAIGGPETAQDDIDAMFAEGPAGQDDIDALFSGDDAEDEEVSQDDIDALFD